MLVRVCAIWLVVLILLPFSAPFSTCDVATFFSGAPRSSPTHPLKARPNPSLADAASSHALTPSRVSQRVKFVSSHLGAVVSTLAVCHSSSDVCASPVAVSNSPLVSPLRI